jgi:LmbE family N-acetylglucosaminyl deacetylase
MFEDSVLIVAHPDDDILWLSSVLDEVDDIIFCFNDFPRHPEIGIARKKVIAEYSLPNIASLDIVEPNSFNQADWSHPVITEYGIKLVKNHERDAGYRATYEELVDRVKGKVAGRKNVFTHNPWGEYGHEDHVLVYRALKHLQVEYGYQLWFSNYCSTRSITLMNNYISGFDSRYECRPVNLIRAQELAELYKKHGCWTWFQSYQWFEHECFMREAPSSEKQQAQPYGHSFPVNYIKWPVDGKKADLQPHSLLTMAARIKAKLKRT